MQNGLGATIERIRHGAVCLIATINAGEFAQKAVCHDYPEWLKTNGFITDDEHDAFYAFMTLRQAARQRHTSGSIYGDGPTARDRWLDLGRHIGTGNRSMLETLADSPVPKGDMTVQRNMAFCNSRVLSTALSKVTDYFLTRP